MRFTFRLFSLLVLLAATSTTLHAQGFSHKESFITLPLSHVVNLATASDVQTASSSHYEIPAPGGVEVSATAQIKANLAKLRAERGMQSGAPMANMVPLLARNFKANTANGTPNDNSMAISNGGKVVSVVNTNIRVYDSVGTQLVSKTLGALAGSVGPLARTFDPRAIYDPLADRFIVVFLNGTEDSTNNPILCFSLTNDPAGLWNCYKLPGNPLPGDSTWSDYPIVSISKDELFITFNQLKNNTDWRSGFTRSLIWQVPMSNGYSGAELASKLYSEIKYDGRFVWSVCPVHAGSEITGPNMYFLSVRPDAEQNDTVFLHEVTNTIASGSATLAQKVLISDVKYGVPPNADQPRTIDTVGNYLQTNDARVLDATIRNNTIHFVGNTVDMENLRSGLYIGKITDPSSPNAVVRGRIHSEPELDFGYPSIVDLPQGLVMTFSHASSSVFPGTSAGYLASHSTYIDRIVVKDGTAPINLLADSVERWGDYTGIQSRYSDPDAVWLSGSFGIRSLGTNTHQTWVGEVRLEQASVDGPAKLSLTRSISYPNPTSGNVQLDTRESSVKRIQFVNSIGTLTELSPDFTSEGVSIDLSDQPNGVYHITIEYNDGTQERQKVVLSR